MPGQDPDRRFFKPFLAQNGPKMGQKWVKNGQKWGGQHRWTVGPPPPPPPRCVSVGLLSRGSRTPPPSPAYVTDAVRGNWPGPKIGRVTRVPPNVPNPLKCGLFRWESTKFLSFHHFWPSLGPFWGHFGTFFKKISGAFGARTASNCIANCIDAVQPRPPPPMQLVYKPIGGPGHPCLELPVFINVDSKSRAGAELTKTAVRLKSKAQGQRPGQEWYIVHGTPLPGLPN